MLSFCQVSSKSAKLLKRRRHVSLKSEVIASIFVNGSTQNTKSIKIYLNFHPIKFCRIPFEVVSAKKEEQKVNIDNRRAL